MKQPTPTVRREILRQIAESPLLCEFKKMSNRELVRVRGDFADTLFVQVEWSAAYRSVRAGAVLHCGSQSLHEFIMSVQFPEGCNGFWKLDYGSKPRHRLLMNLEDNGDCPTMTPWVLRTDTEVYESLVCPARVFDTPEALAASIVREIERRRGLWDSIDSRESLYRSICEKAAGQGKFSTDIMLQACASCWIGDLPAVHDAIARYEVFLKQTEELHLRSRRHEDDIHMFQAILVMLRNRASQG